MGFGRFEMERYQSTYEHEVAYNLSESGVEPLELGELMELAGRSTTDLEGLGLGYNQSNGEAELRERIAAQYPGAGIDDVLVTVGSAEANFINAWELMSPGDEIVFMTPNYMQLHGLVRSLGGTLREWPLREEAGWQPDPSALRELVGPETRAIVLTNPNNPTGAILGREAMEAAIDAASRVGAWILCDEVYRGAERGGEETPSLWGEYDRAIVTSGLSKAFGLPGLRVGWVVAPAERITELWARKDYTTIAAATLSDRLAQLALSEDVRGRLLERTRRILRDNWEILESWLEERSDVFTWEPPRAGAIAYVRYRLPVDSMALAERLRREGDCLVVPGAHFDMPDFLRIGFGPEASALRAGLARLAEIVDEVASRAIAAPEV